MGLPNQSRWIRDGQDLGQLTGLAPSEESRVSRQQWLSHYQKERESSLPSKHQHLNDEGKPMTALGDKPCPLYQNGQVYTPKYDGVLCKLRIADKVNTIAATTKLYKITVLQVIIICCT